MRTLQPVRLRPLVFPRTVMGFVVVGLGGALGSMTRYAVGLAVSSSTFPYATLTVNVIGCFCIGLALPSAERAAALSPDLRLLLVVGFLGGFTTFSAFGYETLALLRSGAGLALLNVAANVVLGLLAVLLGRHAGS